MTRAEEFREHLCETPLPIAFGFHLHPEIRGAEKQPDLSDQFRRVDIGPPAFRKSFIRGKLKVGQREIFPFSSVRAASGKRAFCLNVEGFRGKTVKTQEILKCQRFARVGFEVPDQRLHPRFAAPKELPDVFKNDRLSPFLDFNHTAARESREPRLDLLHRAAGRDGEESSEPLFEVVPGVCLADKIEHRKTVLLIAVFPKSPAKLLKENCEAFGRSQEQDRIDAGDVDAFVKDVDRH